MLLLFWVHGDRINNMGKRIGPALVAVSEARPAEGGSSQSPVYRNILSENGFPEDFHGCTTTYEVFNHSVERFSTNKYVSRQITMTVAPKCWVSGKSISPHPVDFHPRRCIGARTVDAQGVAGPFEWITYAELAAKARGRASGLRHIGAKPHAKIGVFAANCPEWMVAIRATDVLGGTIVPSTILWVPPR